MIMTDSELIELIKKDPDKGIPIVIDLYGDTVKTVCNNILYGFDYDISEDAWSETFFKLWKNAKRYDPVKGASLKTYIAVLARNTSFDMVRKLSKHQNQNEYEDSIRDKTVNVEEEIINNENLDMIYKQISMMEEPDRKILLLRYFYMYSIKEIAEKLSIEKKKVENTIFRKKSILRDMITDGDL